MTSEEYLLSIILVLRLKVTGLWCNHDASSKPAIFFMGQGCDSASVGKDLGHLLCGSSLEDFYLRVSWRTPMCHFFNLVKV